MQLWVVCGLGLIGKWVRFLSVKDGVLSMQVNLVQIREEFVLLPRFDFITWFKAVLGTQANVPGSLSLFFCFVLSKIGLC